ncbi:MAG: EamA family transporter [Chloroflexi bacterium]|nr:MAG: EamA family transporter [Chloroflexota bacterium]
MIRETFQQDSRVLAAFTAMVFIGGTNFVAVRLSDRGLAPLYGAGIRFLGAAVLLYLYVALRGIALPTRAQLKGTLLYGVLGFAASYAFAYLALVSLSSGVAAVIMGSVPLITLLLAVAHGVERFRLRGLVGATIAIAGIIILVGAPTKAHIPVGSLFLMLGAAFSASESGIVLKKYPTGHPMATNALAMAVGGILLLGLSLVSGEHWSLPAGPATWASLTYLVLLGSIGLFALFLFALKRWTASRVSYMFVLTPIIASILGAALAGESVTAATIVGGIIVLFGVYVGALSRSSSPEPRLARAKEQAARA